jgi:hypothetical protein
LELIADRIDSTHADFELEHDAELLGARLRIDSIRVEEIMRYFVSIELFENENDRITCLKLASRIENSIVKNPELAKVQASLKSRKISENLGKIQENAGQIRLDKDIDKIEKREDTIQEPASVEEVKTFIAPNKTTGLGLALCKAWAELPKDIPKPYGANGTEVLSDDCRRALDAIRKKGIKTEDVIDAIENYGRVDCYDTWVTQRPGMAKFFEGDLWQRFLPEVFPKSIVRQDKEQIEEERRNAQLERERIEIERRLGLDG